MSSKPRWWNKPLATSQIVLLTVSFVSIAAVAAAVFLYALPVQTEVLDAKGVLEAKKREQTAAMQQYTTDLLDQEKVEQLLKRVPLSRTDSSYLTQLNDLADRHQLVFTSFAAAAERSDNHAEEAPENTQNDLIGLNKTMLTVTVYGKLPDLQSYLADILAADPLFNVTQWSIGQAESAPAVRNSTSNADSSLNGKMMVMNMMIETYLGPQYASLLQSNN